MVAYLVIREGSNWSDVFRLVPGQSIKLGRAPSNQIVLKDERCSRCHAEVFMENDQWILRDLDSRNGTLVGNQPVQGDHVLKPGDVIRIGRSQLAFVHEIAAAFREAPNLFQPPDSDQWVFDGNLPSDSNVMESMEPTTITHRRGQTRLLEPRRDDETTSSKLSPATAMLCRVAFELAKSPDVRSMAETALEGLFEVSMADAGAVMVAPRGFAGTPLRDDLETVATRTRNDARYHPVSPFLASTVLRDGEAVMARNVMGDSTLGSRDSKGEIAATSVICAPIRRADRVYGLLHLYTLDNGRVTDPEELEICLAVADTMAVALYNLSSREELVEDLNHAQNENRQLRQRLGAESEIIGKSALILRVLDEVARAAPSRATVLIRGESGVGKELVARAVHFASPRAKGPFVCLNCAALTESLLESELFGHERGAFTGATERKIGKFEAANGGTLMLDEIGEMSATIQAKFLRVLEGHAFERVGGSQPVKVDVRVIAATNRDLEKDVSEGRFRRDLFFRLRVLEIFCPALRKRPEDIPEIALHFLRRFNSETGRRIKGFTARAMEQMGKYRWPGNVRELKNVVERAILLAGGDYIDQEDLMVSKLSTAGDTADSMGAIQGFQPISLRDLERKHIHATLNATGWNKSKAANYLGIERSTLDRKIRQYELLPEAPASVQIRESQANR
jgi:Nif-specific regulatory protein